MSSNKSLIPTTYAELKDFAADVAKSTFVPKQFQNKPADCMVAIMHGAELGLKPLQALQEIAVINGKPSLYGDSVLALCRASGLVTKINEYIEGEGENMKAICIIKRKDEEERTFTFSVNDAKSAGLWTRQGPWKQYPKRMLQMRARGFGLRDIFPDVLKGMITREEAEDYPVNSQPEIRDVTNTNSANSTNQSTAIFGKEDGEEIVEVKNAIQTPHSEIFIELRQKLDDCHDPEFLATIKDNIKDAKDSNNLSESEVQTLRDVYQEKSKIVKFA